MRPFVLFSTAALSLALLSVAPAFAQDEHHDDAAPAAHQDDAKPEHQEAAPAHQEEARPENRQDEKAAKPDDKAVHPQDNNARQEARPEDKDTHQNDARPGQDTHAQQAHNGGGRIPDDKFRSHFGRQHTFHIGHPTIVAGQPRFQYGGYWFQFAQPWPAGWSYDDDCYIDYVNDGYYLFDPRYPGVSIAVVVIS